VETLINLRRFIRNLRRFIRNLRRFIRNLRRFIRNLRRFIRNRHRFTLIRHPFAHRHILRRLISGSATPLAMSPAKKFRLADQLESSSTQTYAAQALALTFLGSEIRLATSHAAKSLPTVTLFRQSIRISV
jgi:hypothetical protein